MSAEAESTVVRWWDVGCAVGLLGLCCWLNIDAGLFWAGLAALAVLHLVGALYLRFRRSAHGSGRGH